MVLCSQGLLEEDVSMKSNSQHRTYEISDSTKFGFL